MSLPWNCIPGCRAEWHETISQLIVAPLLFHSPYPTALKSLASVFFFLFLPLFSHVILSFPLYLLWLSSQFLVIQLINLVEDYTLFFFTFFFFCRWVNELNWLHRRVWQALQLAIEQAAAWPRKEGLKLI